MVQENEEWEVSQGPRRAGICSYGYGGTVSHAIVEEHIPPIPTTARQSNLHGNHQVLLLSAPQHHRLTIYAERLEKWIVSSAGSRLDLVSIATTLAMRRDHQQYRAAIISEDHKDAAEKLCLLRKGSPAKWVTSAQVTENWEWKSDLGILGTWCPVDRNGQGYTA